MARLTTLFKNAYPVEADATIRYEKFFFKNTHATDALVAASVWIYYDPPRRFSIGVDLAVDNALASANRATAPTGVTFSAYDTLVGIPGDDLAAGEYIGVWLKQTVALETSSLARPNTTEAVPKIMIGGES